jgi:hypothetical protein
MKTAMWTMFTEYTASSRISCNGKYSCYRSASRLGKMVPLLILTPMSAINLLNRQIWQQSSLLRDLNIVGKTYSILGAAYEKDRHVESISFLRQFFLYVPMVVLERCMIPVQRTGEAISLHS